MLLIINWATILNLCNHNHKNYQQYTPGIPVVDMDKDINSLSEDPHHTIPSPPALNSHTQCDAYANNAMGAGPSSDNAGGHFIGDTGWSEEGAQMREITGDSREC
jgi:hypothetical protein